MEAIPVTLIVKAPNQQIEDQTIQCELSWTIKKLKGYLSEVYPSKPSTDEQKLIYSGKLLPDTVVLKDILRRYEGQDTHTVHLVCIPKNDNTKTKAKERPTVNTHFESVRLNEMDNRNTEQRSTSVENSAFNTDGLHQRLSAQTNQRNENISNNNATLFWTNLNEEAGNQAMAQQLLWLNQAYVQYLNQYMQMIQHGMIPEDAYLQMLQTQSLNVQFTPNAGRVDNEPEIHPQPQAQEPEQPAPAPVNAVGGGQVLEEGVDGERDWLDWFYFMSRLMVLFSIVYFYSSPLRFLVVLLLGTLLHLYQIGFFRNMMLVENNHVPNENNNAPNANAANNNVDIGNNMAQNQDTPAFALQPATTMDITPNEERPPLLAIMWTFVRTFFQSLIPETPNAI